MDMNKYIAQYPIEKNRLIYLVDKVKLAKKNHISVYTDFLTPEEAIILVRMCKDEHLNVDFNGDIIDVERRIGCIYDVIRDEEYPCQIIRITGNFKFEKLSHRDYLGALMSLGIKREKIGDINVFDDGAEIHLHSDICNYIIDNLSKIKHTGVKTQLIETEKAREKHVNYKEMKVIVTSLRLDCIVAGLLNLSRNKAASMIKSGEVKLNHTVEYETNKKTDYKDLVSIKGYGRYIIEESTGLTKSERITLLIKKYL